MMASRELSQARSSGIARVGTRVLIRHPRASDEAEYAGVRAACWEHLRQWEPTPPGKDSPDGNHNAVFERFLATSNTQESQRYLICLLRANDAATSTAVLQQRGTGTREPIGPLIGQVSLNHIGYGAFQNAAAGYWIDHKHQGQGLMREALGLALDVAFDTIRLHRIEANIIPRNGRSIAMVERLGFRLEGTSKAMLRINGVWEDHQRWAILDDEWRARTGATPGGTHT